MAWETRRTGGAYYTRYRRVAGRLVRQYIGIGQEARQAAAEDQARRRQVEADREAARALAEDIQTLNELAELFAHAALLAAGYHRPNRGPWRKRRVRKTPAASTPRPDESPRGPTPGLDGSDAGATSRSGVHG